MDISFKKILKSLIGHIKTTAIIAASFIFFWGLVFLYNNFYQTLGDIQVLSKIKGQVAIKAVDMKLWGQIKTNNELKKQDLNVAEIKNNPF